jgi:hypothetical protein
MLRTLLPWLSPFHSARNRISHRLAEADFLRNCSLLRDVLDAHAARAWCKDCKMGIQNTANPSHRESMTPSITQEVPIESLQETDRIHLRAGHREHNASSRCPGLGTAGQQPVSLCTDVCWSLTPFSTLTHAVLHIHVKTMMPSVWFTSHALRDKHTLTCAPAQTHCPCHRARCGAARPRT